jgi:hypothetical protein
MFVIIALPEHRAALIVQGIGGTGDRRFVSPDDRGNGMGNGFSESFDMIRIRLYTAAPCLSGNHTWASIPLIFFTIQIFSGVSTLTSLARMFLGN